MPAVTTILLDRDGTVIKDKHYLSDPGGVELLPGVAEGLSSLFRKGVRFFVVSNQSGIGRGMFPREAAVAVNERLAEMLRPYGVAFTDIRFCPHAPEAGCACRKPATGMWDALRKQYGLKAENTLMLGDKEEDILFASHAGLALRGLVLTGKGEETAKRLALPEPGVDGLSFTAHPGGPSRPHLVLSSFHALEAGLERAFSAGDAACGA
jgi:D-glycero-D-manno-heptose 1,7-bisphosphate phosphatase